MTLPNFMVIGLQIEKSHRGRNPTILYKILKTSLNFKLSFVGINDVLREIWLSKYDFQARNFVQTLSFWEYHICQLFLKSKW